VTFCLFQNRLQILHLLGLALRSDADVLIASGSSTFVSWLRKKREFVLNLSGGAVFGRKGGGDVLATSRY
jgi:hypothetical protein